MDARERGVRVEHVRFLTLVTGMIDMSQVYTLDAGQDARVCVKRR